MTGQQLSARFVELCEQLGTTLAELHMKGRPSDTPSPLTYYYSCEAAEITVFFDGAVTIEGSVDLRANHAAALAKTLEEIRNNYNAYHHD